MLKIVVPLYLFSTLRLALLASATDSCLTSSTSLVEGSNMDVSDVCRTATFRRLLSRSVLTIAATAFFLTASAFASDPTSGTIDVSATAPVTWVSNSTGVPATGGESTCVDGTSCDVFTLTVSPGTWTGKRIAVKIQWTLSASDYDLYVHK